MFPQGFNPMAMMNNGMGGMPNPFGGNSNNYINEDQRREMERQGREVKTWMERCLVDVVENGDGDFLRALENRMGDSYYSIAERGGRGGRSGGRDGGRGGYRSSYASRDRDYRKDRGRREREQEDCMQNLWCEIEELEKKSKKGPGFNMKSHLKKEYPELDEEEIKVVSHLAERGGMHQFARDLGMDVQELYEVIRDISEKMEDERN